MYVRKLSATAAAALFLFSASASLAQNAPPPSVSPVPAPAIPSGATVVGQVFDTKITWDDLIQYMQTSNPAEFDSLMANLLGAHAAAGLFGPNSQPSVTITKEQALALLRQSNPPLMGQTLQSILERDMLQDEAAKKHITVTNAEVDMDIEQRLSELRTSGRIPVGETDDQFLASQHLTKAGLRKVFLPVTILNKLLTGQLEKVYGHAVTNADYVQASHILIKVPPVTAASTPAEKKADASALAKLEKIRSEIVAGKITFAAAAKKYSQDASNAPHGGDLGPFMRGFMVAPFDKAVFSLKPDVVSQPVRTVYGYHLIMITKTGGQLTSMQKLQALQSRESSLLSAFLASLEKKAQMKNTLQQAAPLPPQQDNG